MAKVEYPSDKLDQYMVRFPEGMRDQLKSAAAQNNRSLNAEIIDRLDSTFQGLSMDEVLEFQHKRIVEQEAMMKRLMNTIDAYGELMEVHSNRIADLTAAIRELQGERKGQ